MKKITIILSILLLSISVFAAKTIMDSSQVQQKIFNDTVQLNISLDSAALFEGTTKYATSDTYTITYSTDLSGQHWDISILKDGTTYYTYMVGWDDRKVVKSGGRYWYNIGGGLEWHYVFCRPDNVFWTSDGYKLDGGTWTVSDTGVMQISADHYAFYVVGRSSTSASSDWYPLNCEEKTVVHIFADKEYFVVDSKFRFVTTSDSSIKQAAGRIHVGDDPSIGYSVSSSTNLSDNDIGFMKNGEIIKYANYYECEDVGTVFGMWDYGNDVIIASSSYSGIAPIP